MKTIDLVKDCLLAADTLRDLDTFGTGQSILKDAATRLVKQEKALRWIVKEEPTFCDWVAFDINDVSVSLVTTVSLAMVRDCFTNMYWNEVIW